jgi:hypothetical protein
MASFPYFLLWVSTNIFLATVTVPEFTHPEEGDVILSKCRYPSARLNNVTTQK